MHLEHQSREQLKQGVDDNTAEAARLLLDENNIEAARKHLDWADMARDVLKSERRPPQSFYLAGIITLICLSLVGISWSLHKAANPVLLDLTTESVSLRLRAEWTGNNLEIPAKQLSLDNLQHIQAGSLGIDGAFEFIELAGRDIALDQLSLPAGAELELRTTAKGFTLTIHEATVSGSLSVRDAWLRLAGKETLLERDIQVPLADFPPEFIRFSATADQWPVRIDIETDKPWHLARLNANDLHFNQIDTNGNVLSTVEKGLLKLPQVAQEIQLLEADLLQLGKPHSARLIVERAENNIRVQFQGEVDNLFAGPEGFVKNHTPTWLEYFYHHQQLAFFWSALVFLWGLLWKLRSFW
jgi:hypothetical protein